ncbi:oxidoreductase,short chain dehydrogenase-like protein [Clavulina sp. PMI_390]|nr:oxidoreductase,short chain dehydrogenase-like protein [Clavulina sp. PMI_390]
MVQELSSSTEPLVWFITGCSSGFGEEIALEALKRGDQVIASARQPLSRLDNLAEAGAHIMECDVTIPSQDMKTIAEGAEKIYGRIDVLVNNAGYGHFGSLEELGPEGLLTQFQTNLFGTANATSAFLPLMRRRRSGTVVITGSRSGMRLVPMLGAYGISKAATNAYGETLAKEVAQFNIRVLTTVPGGFHTSGYAGNPVPPPMPGPGYEDYAPTIERFRGMVKSLPGSQLGDPVKYATLLCDVATGDGKPSVRPWPERLVIGSDAAVDVREMFARWEASMQEYEDLGKSTDSRAYPSL